MMRHEVKLLVPAAEIGAWRHRVRLHPAGFRRAYEPRFVHSVYLDTHGLACFEDNLAGVSARTKVRYRWYSKVPETDLMPGNLELKHKRGGLGRKELFPIADPARADWAAFHRSLRASVPERAGRWLDDHTQVVIDTSYAREYFISSDRRVRLTIDTQLRASDQLGHAIRQASRRVPLAPVAVVEVKCAEADREAAEEVLQALPARVSRFSKYASAVAALLGP